MRRGHWGSPRLDRTVLHRVVLSIWTIIGLKINKKRTAKLDVVEVLVIETATMACFA
jgi:hypothetical protein